MSAANVLLAVGLAGAAVAVILTTMAVRRRRRLLAYVGSALLISSVVILVIGGFVRAGQLNIVPYEPAWALQNDLASSAAVRSAALVELTGRMVAGRVWTAPGPAGAHVALEAQAHADPWNAEWGRFVEAAHAAGQLPADRWGTYARQAIVARLNVPTTVRPNQSLTLSPSFGVDRCVAAGFAALFDCVDLRIDGRPVALQSGSLRPGLHAGQMAVGNTPNEVGGETAVANEAATASLSAGPHVAALVVRLFLYDPADLARTNIFGGPPPAPAKQLATFDLPVSATFDIVRSAPAPLSMAVDPSRRAAVVAAMRVSKVAVRGGFTSVAVRIAPPPVPVRFAVRLRPIGGGAVVDVGTISCDAGEPGWANLVTSGSLGSAASVDVVFQPDPAGEVTGADGQPMATPAPIWGEEVVAPRVPVERH
jgi:hypothetical protein